MKGQLIRVGVDLAYGHWNAPVDPQSWRFVYVPIPESAKTDFLPGLRRAYNETTPAFDRFSKWCGNNVALPFHLRHQSMHLDPDFEHLTYGDNGARRGAGLCDMQKGDFLVFYAGLRPLSSRSHRLVYAIVGFYSVRDVVFAVNVPLERRNENAHTRKCVVGAPDVIVRAQPGRSGRLHRAIPIGE